MFSKGDLVELQVVNRNGTWYVEDLDESGETICIFESDEPPSELDAKTMTVQVKKFRRGISSDTNYLTIQAVDNHEQSQETVAKDTNTGDGNQTSKEISSKTDQSYPKRKLINLRGSGDYITIEAKIVRIEFVDKNNSDIPDMRGVLGEDNSTKKVPFVVESGVTHPYFERGKRFQFQGIKDHRYERENEIQVLITNRSEIIEL